MSDFNQEIEDKYIFEGMISSGEWPLLFVVCAGMSPPWEKSIQKFIAFFFFFTNTIFTLILSFKFYFL